MNAVYFDTETEGLDPYVHKITLVQLNQSKKIKIFKSLTPKKIKELKDVLENNLVVGHNLKFDLKFLKHYYNIEPLQVFDTWIAEILISGGQKARAREAASLKAVTELYTGIQLDKDPELRLSFKGGELTPKQINYAAMDVAVLPEIHRRQQQQLNDLGLGKVFETEMSCIPATVWLELSGAPIDLEGLKKLESTTKEKLEDARLQVFNILRDAGYKNLDLSGLPVVNLDSSKQLKSALWKIGLDVESTDDSTLSGLEHPVGEALKKYRKYQKLLNTFLEKLPKHINPVTGRIHANFNQYGTLAGRFSCSSPNMQQLPKDNNFRALLKGSKGSKIITADYSQVELRILAEVSQESKFIELFNKGGDLHKLTGSLVFNKPQEQITKGERDIAKIINFGLNYGMSWKGLQTNLRDSGINITETEAKAYIASFFINYNKVAEYLDSAGKFAVSNNFIRNKAGRIIKYRPASDERERAFIFREGKNNPIQSLNADILKIAMGKLHHKLKPYNAKLINAVHDELVFEVPDEYVEKASEIIKEEMEAAGREFLKSVPCVVEVKIGEAWGK